MSRPWFLAILALGTVAAPSTAQDWQGRARVDGRVTDAGGAPFVGATVSVERASGQKGPRVTTNAEGEWVVDGIAPGSWTIVVSAPGYRTVRLGVHLPQESSWVAPPEVRLDRESPPTPDPPEPEESSEPLPTPDPPEPEGSRGEIPSTNLRPGVSASDPEDVRAALAGGRMGRARDLAAALGADDPAAAPLLVEVGAALLEAGRTADAVACLDRAIEAAPDVPEAHYRRALGLLALGRGAEAGRDFETVLELAPVGPHAAKARLALDGLAEGAE
jgi:hypothetical protein